MRLLNHVEGQTEETFTNELLAPYLYAKGYTAVGARLLGNARLRSSRGGICGWPTARKEILRHLRSDGGAAATTMVDYYALPASGISQWPGRAAAVNLPFAQRAESIQKKLREDIAGHMGSDFDPDRFIPFVVMHEFEGLLFSDCGAFARGIGRSDLRDAFQAIRDQFDTPEEINDSPVTAPSKRIEKLVENYEKPLLGNLAALEVGLDAISQQCPNFADWLTRLEAII